MSLKKVVLPVVVAAALAACAAGDPNKRGGADVGAIAGGAVGRYMDNQQKEFEAALADEAREHQVEIERTADDFIIINLSNEVSFDFDSASLKPAFLPSLDRMAQVLNRYQSSIVHVIGHTDSTGSEEYNQRLSERRARSVATYLESRDVLASRLRTEGRGESDPMDSNATEAGRRLNRRVELVIKPVVEGRESDAYRLP